MRVGITGHRGLSTEVEERVRVLLADAVDGHDAAALVAVSCIADGPDAWFAEAVLWTGGHLEAVVPTPGTEDVRGSFVSWHSARPRAGGPPYAGT